MNKPDVEISFPKSLQGVATKQRASRVRSNRVPLKEFVLGLITWLALVAGWYRAMGYGSMGDLIYSLKFIGGAVLVYTALLSLFVLRMVWRHKHSTAAISHRPDPSISMPLVYGPRER